MRYTKPTVGVHMPKQIPSPLPGFDELSIDERIDFVQSLWDRIAVTPEQVPVPEWHRRIIRERLESYRADPTAGRPWTDVRTEIEAKLGDR
jgi:putative addiction module component (TIGR02574 family)